MLSKVRHSYTCGVDFEKCAGKRSSTFYIESSYFYFILHIWFQSSYLKSCRVCNAYFPVISLTTVVYDIASNESILINTWHRIPFNCDAICCFADNCKINRGSRWSWGEIGPKL